MGAHGGSSGNSLGIYGGWFAVLFVKITEPLIFSKRWITLLVVILSTCFFGYQASQLKLSTGFEKQLPLDHSYIKILRHYQEQFGTGNFVLLSLTNKNGDIYDKQFLRSLQIATKGITYMPGVDRTKVKSLWTPNVSYIKAVNGGFVGGNIIPASFSSATATPEQVAAIREHVGLSSVVGRLVADNQRSAMVVGELIEIDPRTKQKLNYIDTGHHLEWIRQKLSSPTVYNYVLKQDSPPFKAGTVVKALYQNPDGWAACLQRLDCSNDIQARLITPDGSVIERSFDADQVVLKTKANPAYNPNVEVRVIGFTKAVSDIADYCLQVAGFFVLTIFLVWILLTFYMGSPVIAIYPLACAVISVIWELGLLHLFGFGLDPFAILVPFLVLSIGVSHGIQITNFWLLEVADRARNSFDAAVHTYRRLVVPGITALITNILGFATIMLVPIGIVQEMAINAMFGLAAVVVCKKILLPCILTFVNLKNPQKFRDYQRNRDLQLRPLWTLMGKLTHKPVAVVMLLIAAVLTLGSFIKYQDLAIGSLNPGVQILKPDGAYNKDSRFISNHYSIGVDVLQIYAKTKSNGCIDPAVMHEIDRFAWYMENTPGVVSTMSMPKAETVVWKKFNEDNPRWGQVPGSSEGLALAGRKFSTSSGMLNNDCSVMPVYIYTSDHIYTTINAVIAAINRYQAEQGEHALVDYQLAGGNVGVAAATNDVIESHEMTVLFWLFLTIGISLLLSFKGVGGLIAVLTPLAMVALYTYAIMVYLDIGLTVATLPVVAFAAGIGVDYGIYTYSVLEENVLGKDMPLDEGYTDALHQTGKAVIVTALTLAASVATWLFSGLQFQIDMGILLMIMYLANAVAALLLLPAFAAFLLKPRKRPTDGEGVAAAEVQS